MSRGEWQNARAAFEEACDEEHAAEALEGLSWSCWWLADAEVLFDARERAYHAYRSRKDARSAARIAIWIAADYVEFRGAPAIANGWMQRAHRLLQGLGTVPESGWLLVLQGSIAILLKQDAAAAMRLGAEAAELGRELHVPDLEAVGLAVQGLATVSTGDAERGASLLDEAMVVAASGEVERPFAVGWVMCYLIYACERMRDYHRAAQWCSKMEELAARWRFRFLSGVCRTHYAGVLTSRGKWKEAEAELIASTKILKETRPPYAFEGIVRMAELRRRQGRIREADDLLLQADGHPLALLVRAELALEEEAPEDARDMLQRYLRQIPDENVTQRAPALELLVRSQLALDELANAVESLKLLESVAESVATPPLKAAAYFAEALVSVASGDVQTASARMKDAADAFQQAGAPYEAACARRELASIYLALGRVDAARGEAEAAVRSLHEIGAEREAGRARALLDQIERKHPAARARAVLTPREIEVLRLVAQGRTDKEVANLLIISRHTVHRHISNIRTKLDAPSRAAAVALAAKQGLV